MHMLSASTSKKKKGRARGQVLSLAFDGIPLPKKLYHGTGRSSVEQGVDGVVDEGNGLARV